MKPNTEISGENRAILALAVFVRFISLLDGLFALRPEKAGHVAGVSVGQLATNKLGVPLGKSLLHPFERALPNGSDVLYPELDFFDSHHTVSGKDPCDPNQRAGERLVDDLLWSGPVDLAKAVGIEADLLNLVQQEWMVRAAVEQRTEVLQIPSSRSHERRKEPRNVLLGV